MATDAAMTSDEPLHVVTVYGQIIVFAEGVEHVLSPAAAEETSRRLASVSAIARMDADRCRIASGDFACGVLV